MKIVNAELIGPSQLKEMVAKANSLGNPLDNVIMNMPPQVEKFVRKDIMRGLEVRKQMEKRNHGSRTNSRANMASFSNANSPAKTLSAKSLDKSQSNVSKDILEEAIDPIYKV